LDRLLFLSHAGIDSEAALQLARRIERSEHAPESGLRVFVDKSELRAGGRWKDQIQQALKDSSAFAVYVGSKGVVNWVWDEVSVALDRVHVEPDYPLIPILSKSANLNALPSFLSQYQAVVDVENRPEEFKRLLSGVLGVKTWSRIVEEVDPFVGLEAFDSRKAHLFFGREPEVEELIELLRDETLLMIVGDSGSGKSSLTRAGLVPAFRGGRLERPGRSGPSDTLWHVIETRPGVDPFGRLADDLRRAAEAAGKSPKQASEIAELVRERNPSKLRDAVLSSAPAEPGLETKVLFVVDQFEELRAASDAADYAAAMVGLTRETDDTIRNVLTMRRDYYFLCKEFPALFQRIERKNRRARYHLRRIPKGRLRDCVIKPLRLAGIPEPPRDVLADAVVGDAGDEPGELALLQMALWRTWDHRAAHGDDLLRAYQAIGRIEGAIAQAADDAFRHLSDEEQKRLETLFIRLVRPGEAGGATRRTARLSEFDPTTQALARKLAEKDWRLLVLGDDTVEIVHEALATQWQRYQQWISNIPNDARGDDLRTLQSLISDAAGWANSEDGAKNAHLARGYDIGLYDDLARSRPNWLTAIEHDYIKACRRSQGSRKRAALVGVISLSVLAIGSTVLGSMAVVQRQEATRAVAAMSAEKMRADAAFSDLRSTQSRFFNDAAKAQIRQGDYGTAIALALEALPHDLVKPDRPYLADVGAVLSEAVHNLEEETIISGHPAIALSDKLSIGSILMAEFSPNGHRLVTAAVDNTARIWDADTGRQVAVLAGHQTSPLAVLLGMIDPEMLRPVVEQLAGAPIEPTTIGASSRFAQLFEHGIGAVLCARYSPDGRRIVTTGTDNTARIWDAESGRQLAVLRHQVPTGGSTEIMSEIVSKIVSGSDADPVRDASSLLGATGLPGNPAWLHDIESRSGIVFWAEFSRDGKRIVSVGTDNTARIWDADSFQQISEFRAGDGTRNIAKAFMLVANKISSSNDPEAQVDAFIASWPKFVRDNVKGALFHAEFSPDGKRIVTGGADNAAWIWDIETNRSIRLNGHGLLNLRSPHIALGAVLSVRYSPDGLRVVTTSLDNAALVWDARTGERLFALDHGFARGRITKYAEAEEIGVVSSAQFSPDGKNIATAGLDGNVRLWDAATGKRVAEIETEFRLGPADESLVAPVLSARFDEDGRHLILSGFGADVRLLDPGGLSSVHHMRGHRPVILDDVPVDLIVHAIAAKRAQRIATVGIDNTVRVWAPIHTDTSEYTPCTAFSPGGERAVMTSQLTATRVWDVQAGKAFVAIPQDNQWCFRGNVFSPDGRRVVSGFPDHTVKVWDAETGRDILTLTGNTDAVTNATFSLDGKRVAAVSADGITRVWDAMSGNEIAVLKIGQNSARMVSLSPDGERAVTASENTAHVWDVATRREIAVLKGHTNDLNSVMFSADGSRVVTASSDKTARVYDAGTGREIAVLRGHAEGLNSAVFSPDGRQVVTASSDRTARVWDAQTGQELDVLKGHTSEVTVAAFSRDGQRVFTASSYGAFRSWYRFDGMQAIIDHARAILPRCVAPGDRGKFFLPTEPPRWCITGSGHENGNPATWAPKWPYDTPRWKDWLIAADAARAKGDPAPPLPASGQ
jgi:WD40 repeat protein